MKYMLDIFTLHSQRKPEVGFPYIAGLGMQLAFVSQLWFPEAQSSGSSHVAFRNSSRYP